MVRICGIVFQTLAVWLFILAALIRGKELSTLTGLGTEALLDTLISTNIIRDTVTDTGIQCLLLCKNNVNCMSMSYRKTSGQCVLHDLVFGSSEVGTSESGWVYYVTGDTTKCPLHKGYFHFRSLNVCHKFVVHQGFSWSQAVSTCLADDPTHAHLSKFDNDDERQAITNIILASSHYDVSYYCGAYKDGAGNNWAWRDGTLVADTISNPWRPGEPSGSGACAYLCGDKPLCRWNDFGCGDWPRALCEIDLS